MTIPHTLVVIPARAGSVGVRRKNLRPINGTPLFLRAANVAAAGAARCGQSVRVVVATDDPDVAAVAEMWDYEVVWRDTHTDGDAPVDLVAVDAAERLGHTGPVMLIQPTCATFTPSAVARMFETMEEEDADGVVAVVRHPKMLWHTDTGPLFTADQRKSRQSADLGLWREVGVFLAKELDYLSPNGSALIPAGHTTLMDVPEWQGSDIDTHADLLAAQVSERLAGGVAMTLAVGGAFGSGHVRRAGELIPLVLDWASEVTVAFRTPDGDPPPGWAVDLVERVGAVVVEEHDPERVGLHVWDALDSALHDHAWAAKAGVPTVCIEDLGAGSAVAVATVNELYDTGTHVGPAWSVIRPAVRFARPWSGPKVDGPVLVTFGGVDPSRLTERFVMACAEESLGLRVQVVSPPGRRVAMPDVPVEHVPSQDLPRRMAQAAVVVTSAGRTVHEAAYLGVPTLSVAANARESTHVHVPGVVSLGWHGKLPEVVLAETAARVAGSAELQVEMHEAVRGQVDGLGAERISDLLARITTRLHTGRV